MAGKGGGGAGGGGRGAARPPAAAAPGAAAAGAAGASGRQIEAFTLHPVVTEKRLLCLEAWGGYALLGLSGAGGGARAEEGRQGAAWVSGCW